MEAEASYFLTEALFIHAEKEHQTEESLFWGPSIQTHLRIFDSEFRSQKSLEAGARERITANRNQCF